MLALAAPLQSFPGVPDGVQLSGRFVDLGLHLGHALELDCQFAPGRGTRFFELPNTRREVTVGRTSCSHRISFRSTGIPGSKGL